VILLRYQLGHNERALHVETVMPESPELQLSNTGTEELPPGPDCRDPLVGRTIAERYVIEKPLGFGGWGMLYKGRDQSLSRDVAIKILHLPFAADPEKRRRFEQEARTNSQLIHPNIASIFDFGVLSTGQPYLIIEHFEGESLFDRLKREKSLPIAQAVQIFAGILDALSCAHDRQIVHRDIKPSNIFLAIGGSGQIVPKLLDFGIAKFQSEENQSGQITKTGETVGSPQYMSPELCNGQPVDGRSDLYSLSCALYETLSGQKVFSGSSFECMNKHVSEKPPSLVETARGELIPVDFDAVIQRGLQKDAQLRFQSAADMKDALMSANLERLPIKPRRAAVMPLLAVIVAGALCIGAIAFWASSFLFATKAAVMPSVEGVELTSRDPAHQADEALAIVGRKHPELALELKKQIAADKLELEKRPGRKIIFGRVEAMDERNLSVNVGAQFLVRDKGYFVYLADCSKPIDFVAHGYSRFVMELPKMSLPGDFVWVGETVLKPVKPGNTARVHFRLIPPKGVDLSRPYADFYPAATEPKDSDTERYGHSVRFQIPSSGELSVDGLSDNKYDIYFVSDQCISTQRQVDLKPGQTVSLGDIQLSELPQLEIDYRASRNGQFEKSILIRTELLANEVHNLLAQLGLEGNVDFYYPPKTEAQKISFYVDHSPADSADGLCDLGLTDKLPHKNFEVGKLRFNKLDTQVVLPGHAYLLRLHGKDGKTSFVVFRMTEHRSQPAYLNSSDATGATE
jgi:hypothetical protein